MKKVLLAVMTCHSMKARADICRATWAKPVEGIDLKFFLGRRPERKPISPPGWHQWLPGADEVALDCDDDYFHLPLKVQEAVKWALENGYDFMAKTDDDVYARPERAATAFPTGLGVHYAGRTRGPSGGKRAPYNSGFFYWLDRKAMEAVAQAKWDGDFAEDRWVGNVLLDRGIQASPDYRYSVLRSKKNMVETGKEGPKRDNQVVASCEWTPAEMLQQHLEFEIGAPSAAPRPAQKGPLDRVCVMVKTFLRDGYLYACLRGLEQQFPECKMVVVDDGHEHPDKLARYSQLRAAGHECVWMPFDSGFGAKANRAIESCDREFVLIGSDDFDFANPLARQGVERMQKVLDVDPKVGVVSGRFNAKPYEFCWARSPRELREEKRVKETRKTPEGVAYHIVDLTANWSLVRRSVFDRVSWDGGDVKIGGGEHAAFYMDVEAAGWETAVVEGSVIYELGPPGKYGCDPKYRDYRGRARSSPERPCLKRREIDRYVLSNGAVEQC